MLLLVALAKQPLFVTDICRSKPHSGKSGIKITPGAKKAPRVRKEPLMNIILFHSNENRKMNPVDLFVNKLELLNICLVC